MRLTRGVLVGGIDPALARELARFLHSDRTLKDVAARMDWPVDECMVAITGLIDAGFIEERDKFNGATQWRTTIAGNALAMASFAKPITRASANATMAGLLERAAKYNSEDSKPFVITQLVVFGSYLDQTVDRVGDLDIAITLRIRGHQWEEPQALLDYGRASGRIFPTFLERLGWGQTEAYQILLNRSGYINITPEDVTTLTDRWQVVYTHE